MKITLVHRIRRQVSPRKGKTRPTYKIVDTEFTTRGSEIHCLDQFAQYCYNNQPIHIIVVRIEKDGTPETV